jgi:O-antigen/teichoic acid export membrane protein
VGIIMVLYLAGSSRSPKADDLTSQPPLSSLKKNYFFSALSAFTNIVYPIVTLAYVARVLGPESMGKYYFAVSLATWFIFAASLGIPVYGAREIGRARANPDLLRVIFSELFVIGFIATIVTLVVYGSVVLAVPQFREEAALFGVLGLLLLANAFGFEYLYAGQERQDLIAYRSIASKLLSVAFIFLLIRAPQHYIRYAWIVAATAAGNALLAAGALRHWCGMAVLRASRLRRHFRPLLWITLSLLLINVYAYLDSVILGLMTTPGEVGLYNAVIRPCRMAVILLSTLAVAGLPRLSHYLANGNLETHRALQENSLNLVLLFAVPISVTFAVSAHEVIGLLYGPEFAKAAVELAWASPLVIANSLTAFQAYQVLFPLRKDHLLILPAAVGALVSVSLNLILIPRVGRGGAVAATLVAEFAVLLAQVAIIRRHGQGSLVLSREAWKYGTAGLVLGASQWLLMPRAAHGFPAVAPAVWLLSGAAYFGVLLASRETLTRQLAVRILRFRA